MIPVMEEVDGMGEVEGMEVVEGMEEVVGVPGLGFLERRAVARLDAMFEVRGKSSWQS